MDVEARIYVKSAGGIIGTYPGLQDKAVPLAPSGAAEFNTLRRTLCPFACWKVENLRFAFDSSFIRPEIAEELAALGNLLREHTREGKRPPLSIFGHADPTGDDDYNKQLSGRRAKAIYALLTRDIDMWENLYTQPYGGDSWSEKQAVSIMLAALGYGDSNEEKMRFQRDQGLEVDGVVGPDTRRALYRAYMNRLCPVTLDPVQDFVGRGQDGGGKGDYQGCSEFNPALLFSQEEELEMSKPQNKTVRDEEYSPNRRVVVFLFRPGSVIDPQCWPCARADEGVAPCKKRFWSDGEQRRTGRLPAQRRRFQDTKDTFACRFYHRMADRSPCEDETHSIPPPRPHVIAGAELRVNAVRLTSRQPVEGAAITVEGPANAVQNTPARGSVRFAGLPAGSYSIRAAHPFLKFDQPVEIRLASGEVREVTLELYQEIKFEILTYNVFLMGPLVYNSGQLTRTELLPRHLEPLVGSPVASTRVFDAIIFNELFWNLARAKFLEELSPKYPLQSSVVTRALEPENGGVVIVGSNRNGFWDKGHHIYSDGCGDDKWAAKGVKHVSIFKEGYNFHIFGTHTQADPDYPDSPAEAEEVRLGQFRELLAYIREKINNGDIRPLSDAPGSPLEPIIIGGDLNVDMPDPGLDKCGYEYVRMLETLESRFPDEKAGKKTWDPATNGLANHYSPGAEPKYFDYLLPCKLGLMPHTSRVTTVEYRTPEGQPWYRHHDSRPYYDLSDHYAVRGEFTYRI